MTVGRDTVKRIGYLCRMKRFCWSYDRFVQSVWVILFLTFVIRYIFEMAPLEATLLALWQVGIAWPITTYLTKTLLIKQIERRRVARFVVQCILCSLLFAVAVPLGQWGFWRLEHLGVFPVSGFFEYVSDYFKYTTAPGQMLDDYIVGIQVILFIIFGFCGLQFHEYNTRIREELARSRIQMLQAQISPHFMFNVLNHVHVLIKREPELADKLLLQYTDILRYQLYSGDKEKIAISQEVRFLQNFVEVEAVRWKNKLDISSRWDVQNPEMEIPSLLFITFVENAFKHVSRSNTMKGYIDIAFVQEGSTISFEVENSNPDNPSVKKEDSGIGLANIKRRLDILFPGRYSLDTENNDKFYRTKLTLNV